MKFRNLGKTGLSVSEIGLGCEHLDRKPFEQTKETIDAALAQGTNFIDCFMPGKEVRENIMKTLGNRRKDIIIQGAVGSTDLEHQFDKSRDMPIVKRYFDDMIRIFGYVDIAMLFFVDSEKDFEDVFTDEYLGYVQSLKQKGDIRSIGVSTHNPVIAKKTIETGIPEVLFFSLNPAFDMLPVTEDAVGQMFSEFKPAMMQGIDPKRSELYQLCEQKNVGITVMKTIGGGKLLSAEHTPLSKPMTVSQCIHYALTRPAVASVLVGCQTAAEVEEMMKYNSCSEEERDYSDILGSMNKNYKGYCLYCNHCLPCPAKIDIADVMKHLDIARLAPNAIPASTTESYNKLSAKASDCTNCGSCESRCPFAVKITENMEEAVKLFK